MVCFLLLDRRNSSHHRHANLMKESTYADFLNLGLDYAAHPSYLLLGSDSYLKEKIQIKIRKQLLAKRQIELQILYADEASLGEISDRLDAYSLFSEYKLLIIRNIDSLKKNGLEMIASYVSNPASDQIVIFTCEKTDAKFNAWKKIKENSVCIVCESPRHGGEVRTWLDAELKANGKSMTQKAKEEFVSRIELDYSTIDNELTKLFLLTINRSNIAESDVDKSLGTSRVGTMIDFYRAFGNRDIKAALTHIHKLLDDEWEPLAVFSMIQRLYLALWKIQLLKTSHHSITEIINNHLHEVLTYYRKEYVEFSAKYNSTELRNAFTVLLDTDAKLKLSMASAEVLLSMCAVRLIQK